MKSSDFVDWAARKNISSNAGCPRCSIVTAYGSSALIALRFEKIRSEFPASIVALSFLVIRERQSSSALTISQRGDTLSDVDAPLIKTGVSTEVEVGCDDRQGIDDD